MEVQTGAAFEITLGKATRVGSYSSFWEKPLSTRESVKYAYVADLDGDSIDEVLLAGFETAPNAPEEYDNTRIMIFGWKSGRFQDLTEMWLPSGLGHVEGVGNISFADFNNDGRIDFFTSAYADMDYSLSAYEFLNQGGSFGRRALDQADGWQHDSAVLDINRDGYDDVFATGYSSSPRIYLGGPTGLSPDILGVASEWPGASGVAMGDFMGDGGVGAILVDWTSSVPIGGSALFDLEPIDGSSQYRLKLVSMLPPPILDGDDFIRSSLGSHDVRVEAFDFSGDGLDDAVVFSRGSFGGQKWVSYSAIQFLQNLGGGSFRDVTAERLVGYDHRSSITYTPVIRDFNGDGRADIFSLDSNYEVANSTTFLMGAPDGAYVDSGRIALSSRLPMESIATVAQGPDGAFHLVWDPGRNGTYEVFHAPLGFSVADRFVLDAALDFASSPTAAKSLEGFSPVSGDVLDLSGVSKALDLDLWWSVKAPSKKIDATGAVWLSKGVLQISADADRAGELFVKLIGVKALAAGDVLLG